MALRYLKSSRSKEPYESSKWATNLIAFRMNDRFKAENVPITSIMTSPGVVASNIANLPDWVRRVRRMVHYSVSARDKCK
jgi:hypothetical protein